MLKKNFKILKMLIFVLQVSVCSSDGPDLAVSDHDIAAAAAVAAASSARRQSSSGSVQGSGNPYLNTLIPRQLSQTHSEPDNSTCDPLGTKPSLVERSVTWAEPRIKVIPPPGARSMLMAMHTEYTRYY